jgi:hypothetical protein
MSVAQGRARLFSKLLGKADLVVSHRAAVIIVLNSTLYYVVYWLPDADFRE